MAEAGAFSSLFQQDSRDARISVHQGGPRQEEASSLAGSGRTTRRLKLFAHAGRVDEPAGLGGAAGHRGVAQRRVREQGSLRPPERGG